MLSEQDVDRELKAALSVSPSPNFEARVLRRVEADRPAHRLARYTWFAAAAAVVIAAGVWYALQRPSVVAPGPTLQVVRQTPPPVLPRRETPTHRPTIEPRRIEAVRASRGEPRTAEPEVIVPVNRMEALRRLVRAVNEGRIEPPGEPPQGPMAAPATLDVAPLVVEPIAVPPVAPGADAPSPAIQGLK